MMYGQIIHKKAKYFCITLCFSTDVFAVEIRLQIPFRAESENVYALCLIFFFFYPAEEFLLTDGMVLSP